MDSFFCSETRGQGLEDLCESGGRPQHGWSYVPMEAMGWILGRFEEGGRGWMVCRIWGMPRDDGPRDSRREAADGWSARFEERGAAEDGRPRMATTGRRGGRAGLLDSMGRPSSKGCLSGRSRVLKAASSSCASNA